MAEGEWRAGRWYPDGWEWDSDTEGRDHGHRVRLVRIPVPRRDGSPSGRYLVIVRLRPEDPDPATVRAVLRIMADQDVVKVLGNRRTEEVFTLAGPSLRADAVTLHGTLDMLPGWPVEPPAEPTSAAPFAPPQPPQPSKGLPSDGSDLGRLPSLPDGL
jgi:hypothetical protein